MKKQAFSFDKIMTFPFMGAGIFLIAVIIFWTKIVSLFKPKGYEEEVQLPIHILNNLFLSRGWMDAKGNFKTSQGIVTKYNIQQANSHALQLADCMNTSKRDSWYERIVSFTVSPTSYRIKSILNPNYPSSYRRYVIQAYSDIYTHDRNLQSDVRGQMVSVLGISEWTNNLTKYFIL